MRAITDDMIHMLLERLSKRNITIWTEAGKIKYKAPAGALTSEELQCIKENKEKIIKYLENHAIWSKGVKETFPLTSIQKAYLIGSDQAYELGGINAHYYMELNCCDIDVVRFERAVNEVIARTDAMRTIVLSNGMQMCLEEIYSSIQSVVLITPMPVRNNFLQLLQMSKKQRKNNLEYILFSERLDSERKEYYMSLLDKESKKVEYAMMKRQKKFSIYVRKIPTLVIGSYNDQCVILQAVKDNAKIHTAELKIVDSVCHDMMLDPDWRNIADLIFKFIEKTIDKKSGDNYNDNYVSTQAHQGGE